MLKMQTDAKRVGLSQKPQSPKGPLGARESYSIFYSLGMMSQRPIQGPPQSRHPGWLHLRDYEWNGGQG